MLVAFLKGALAGLGATVPMTVAMVGMHKNLPEEQATKEPLPPRKITANAFSKAGVFQQLNEEERYELTMVSHFGYGAATGAIYGVAAEKIAPLRTLAGGATYGVAVWAASYLGLMPALGFHKPATKDRAERNGLMIAAHVVWGASLAASFLAMTPEKETSVSARAS